MAGPEGDALSTNKVARPTTADVARLASVSTATVSYVFNNAEGRRISAPTREAVYRAAEQLGYRPNLAARNLARGKSGVVLYVVPRVAVGEMPMQAGSRMTTELARQGLLQVQIFEAEDDQHVVDAVENLDPVAVTSLFPFSAAASARCRPPTSPTSKSERCPHSEIHTCRSARCASSIWSRVVTGGSRSPTPGSPNGVPWATTGSKVSSRAARSRDLPPIPSARSRWTMPRMW